MKTIIHKAEDRGHANHGWLNAKHSFSFAGWYNPEKIQFGALRVLNDDEVAPGMGFSMHPHDNMEIITLVQEGELEHKDSMGNGSIIKANEVQVMSAGSGVYHSEKNASKSQAVKLFQIWIFPNKDNVQPRYAQKSFPHENRINTWQEIIKPQSQIEGDAIYINQDAWFNITELEKGNELQYTPKKKNNGAYLFVINGEIEVENKLLKSRDAIGITEYDAINIKANENSKLLLMDIPMHLN